MSAADFLPISGSHLTFVVAWLTDKGHVESTSSPLLAANMSVEPPELLPLVHTATPEGAPVRRVLHDKAAGVWWDLKTGAVLTQWKEVVAPLYAIWDANQPAPLPAAPPQRRAVEIPS